MSRPRNGKIGSIVYDKQNHRWRCIYYVIDTNTYKEVRKYKSFHSEKEAQDFFATIQYQKNNPAFIEHNGIPLNLLMKAAIQNKYENGQIQDAQYTRLLKTLKAAEKSQIIHKNISDITTEELQAYVNSLRDYSDSSIKKIMELVKQGFKMALNKGYIMRSPLEDVVRPKSKVLTKKVMALTVEDQQKLSKYLMNIPIYDVPYKNVYLIQMYTGLRIGEAVVLKLDDIDLKNDMMSINKTLARDKNDKRYIKPLPKTISGVREVPIPSFIKPALMYQMELAKNNKENLLFVSSTGGYVEPTVANRELKNIAKKLGIPNVTTHVLRHTYSTRCVEADMRPVALKELMGHSDIQVTMNVYTSVLNKFKQSEIDRVNKYYLENEIIDSNDFFIGNEYNSDDKER